MTNRGQLIAKMQRREAFRAGNMTAHRYGNGHYRVYSYAVPILSIDPTGRVVFFDNRKYSTTTSAHQGIVAEAYPEASNGHAARVVYEPIAKEV